MSLPAPQGREEFLRWLRQNEPAMRRNPELRSHNTVVALQLLPLFEAEPRGWESLASLNLGTRDRGMPLATFLAEWRENSPARLRPFVGKVAQVVGIGTGRADIAGAPAADR